VSAPLVFVASDRREAEPLVAHWEEVRPTGLPVHWSRAGKWKGREVVAIANGVGRARAVAGVKTAGKVAGICSIGTGGALVSSLALSDIVVASVVEAGNEAWPAADPKGGQARHGRVHSSHRILGSSEEKRNLSATGAILVEMEAAGVARFAHELAVPFYCVRVVSDLAEESFFFDFNTFLMADGRFSLPRLTTQALLHPVSGLGELLRLQRRTAAASKKLGDYLADCEFPI
jgi:nucleoside phosphorylase